jgi:hypothetical protein
VRAADGFRRCALMQGASRSGNKERFKNGNCYFFFECRIEKSQPRPKNRWKSRDGDPSDANLRFAARDGLSTNSNNAKRRQTLVISYPHSSSRLLLGHRTCPALDGCESPRAAGASCPKGANALSPARMSFPRLSTRNEADYNCSRFSSVGPHWTERYPSSSGLGLHECFALKPALTFPLHRDHRSPTSDRLASPLRSSPCR